MERLRAATGEDVEYAPFQEPSIARRFPAIPRADCERAVQLVLTDGSVMSGAEAVLRVAALAGREGWLYWCYQNAPGFAAASEFVYRNVASHRVFFSKLDRIFLGPRVSPPAFAWTRSVFLRGLGIIYLTAFVSFWVQERGLIGGDGIMPAASIMEAVKSQAHQAGMGAERFHLFPTFAWMGASDHALALQCGAGVAAAVGLTVGVAPALMLVCLWALYLSLSVISSPFLDFQWDNLLLETGFLAIFLAPLQMLDRPSRQPPPSRIAVWLLRWLIFRLMFESGCVKLLSGDASWWNLTALRVHYETQPLPTWIGWYFHQASPAIQAVSTAIMFLIELVVPFFIFAGRIPRISASILFTLLQIAILLTGNYTFFNWLAILLCVPLLDDEALAKLTPHRRPAPARPRGRMTELRWNWKITAPVAIVIISITFTQLLAVLGVVRNWPRPIAVVADWLSPFRSFNNYGLFAVMTQTRPEIVVEGSDDGGVWQAYEFKYKPGPLDRRPGFVAPYQPRLDWQMWFAALGSPRENQWFIRFEYQLLRGSPDVLGLLRKNPFPHAPPKYIRAQLYEYHFSDWKTRRQTGDWWTRKFLRPYVPPLSLEAFQR